MADVTRAAGLFVPAAVAEHAATFAEGAGVGAFAGLVATNAARHPASDTMFGAHGECVAEVVLGDGMGGALGSLAVAVEEHR